MREFSTKLHLEAPKTKSKALENEDKIRLILLENELNQAIADRDDYEHRFLRK